MNRVLLILLATLLAVSVVACAAPEPAPAPAPAPPPDEEEEEAAPSPAPEKKSYRFVMATECGTEGTPYADFIDKWAQLIGDATDGRIQLDTYYEGQLGYGEEMQDSLLKGTNHMQLSWPTTSYDPRTAVRDTPYMFFDWPEAMKVLAPSGWVYQVLDPVFNDLGLKFLGAYPEGFVGIGSKGKYATNPEQAAKMKLRSFAAFPYPQAVEAMGYQSAVIGWGEVYTAIQTGVVDGDSNNVIFWDQEYFGDQLDYWVYTKHFFQSAVILMNMEAFNSLDAEDQQIVVDVTNHLAEEVFAEAEQIDLNYRQEAIDKGIEFIEMTPAEFAANVKLVREKIWPQMEEKVGTYLMDKIRAGASEPPQ